MANVMLFYGFGKTLFHKCVSEEMCVSPSESTAGVGGTPTGCKGGGLPFPRLKPGVIDTAAPPGRTPTLTHSRWPRRGAANTDSARGGAETKRGMA